MQGNSTDSLKESRKQQIYKELLRRKIITRKFVVQELISVKEKQREKKSITAEVLSVVGKAIDKLDEDYTIRNLLNELSDEVESSN